MAENCMTAMVLLAKIGSQEKRRGRVRTLHNPRRLKRIFTPDRPDDRAPKHCPACNLLVARPVRPAQAGANDEAETEMPSYHGSCHCGAVRFRIDAAIEELTTCDCSLCSRKNALMTKVHESELTVLDGAKILSAYEWNTHRAKHFFCSRCGVYTFHRKRAAPDHFGINVFCLEGFDPASVPVRATEGIGMSVIDSTAPSHWKGPRELA